MHSPVHKIKERSPACRHWLEAAPWEEPAAKDDEPQPRARSWSGRWCSCSSSAAASFPLESLREKLRELFVQEPDATVRAAASVGGFELLQVLLKTTQKLEKLGLRLDLRAGSVRITTGEVRPPALANYFAALAEQSAAGRGEGAAPDPEQAAGPLSTTGLEVLACIAFKQPLSLPEINGYFSSDKRAVVHRLQHLGWWIAAKRARPAAPCG